MLSATRKHAVRRLANISQTRAYATVEASEAVQGDVPLTVAEAETRPAKPPRTERPVDRRRRPTIYIRASGRMHDMNMADAFSVIRAIERKFGTLREYQFLRDSEQSTAYQSVIFAEFLSQESMDRVKAAGRQVSLKVPLSPPEDVTGSGIGLDQLAGLLEPQKMGASNVSSSKISERVHELDVIIEPTVREHPFRSSAPKSYHNMSLKAFGQAFYNWGGFAQLSPLNATSSPYTENSTTTSQSMTIDREHMRQALSRWAKNLDRPDPSFPPTPLESTPPSETDEATTTEASSQDEAGWTPIQDPMTTTASEPISPLDAPVSDGVQQSWQPEAGAEKPQLPSKPKKTKANKVSQRERLLAGIRSSARFQAEQAAGNAGFNEDDLHTGLPLASTPDTDYMSSLASRQQEMQESEQAWDATMRSMGQRNTAGSRAQQQKSNEEQEAPVSATDKVFGFIKGLW